jgi:hypothetical protein
MKSLLSPRHAGVILAALILGTFTVRAHSPAEEMADAANRFLAALSPEQKQKANYKLTDEERLNWHFVPKIRNGLPLKEMAQWQRPLAHALLGSGLSQQGILKAETIMSLEEVLRELESKNPRMVRDAEMYYVTIFGVPGAGEPWGWRLEGHHISLNFSVTPSGGVSASPSFLGSNPGEVRDGPRKGLRVLGAEEDLGRKLVKSFNAEQRAKVIFTKEAPSEVITGNKREVTPLEAVGITAATMDAAQKEMLMDVVREYINRERPELAKEDLAKIEKAGVDKISFAWAGGIEPREPHYYRVQGPTFLLEYDNTQNDANHVHAVWRDFKNDFGADLLREHYQKNKH